MKKILVFLGVILTMINAAYAADVGIIVELEDGSVKTDCISAEEGTDGYELLQNSNFDILWSPESAFGQLICKIDGEGTNAQGSFCEYFGKFWNFNIQSYGENSWIHSPVGHNGPGGCWNRKENSFAGHYCALDKDVIGYKFGEGAEGPPLRTFKQVCENLGIKSLKAYVDGKKDGSADEKGGKIEAAPGSKLEIKIELENLYEEDIKIEDISVEGILRDIAGNDLEDEKSIELNSGDSKEATLRFNIPKDTEEDDYDLTIDINGKNERGFQYSKKIEFEIEIEKEKYNAVFDKLEFSGRKVECGNDAKLLADIANLGSSKENAVLKIFNEDFGINVEDRFELSNDIPGNRASKSYLISIPKAIKPGKYVVAADLISSNKIKQSSASLDITCKGYGGQIKGQRETLANSQESGSRMAGGVIASNSNNNKNPNDANKINPEAKSPVKKAILISVLSMEILGVIGASIFAVYLIRK